LGREQETPSRIPEKEDLLLFTGIDDPKCHASTNGDQKLKQLLMSVTPAFNGRRDPPCPIGALRLEGQPWDFGDREPAYGIGAAGRQLDEPGILHHGV